MIISEKAAPLTEKQFQQQVVELAKILGWRVYHPFLSKWSEKGFPDLTMVRSYRLLFVELKAEKGKVSAPQAEWHEGLSATCAEVYVWRPSDWDMIQATMR